MKTTAVQDMKLTIEAATERSKEDIGNAIKNKKSSVLKDINNEYNAILKELKSYNTTKEDLESVTAIAIEAVNTAKLTGQNIRDTMIKIFKEHKKVDQDIIISRASITQAYDCKRELDLFINTASNNVTNLGKDTESYAATITTVTLKAKDEAVSDTTTYLPLNNNTILHTMEQVFTSNMQLGR